MNILINASLPGCGKTYLLTKLFKEYQPKPYEKVVFITKANKALDNARSFLTGEKLEDKSFKTLDQFKENWKIIPNDNGEEVLKHLKSKPHISRYYYTLFIDEISMVSQYELDDLLENFLVANIIAAGDTSQHAPIPTSFYEKTINGLSIYNDNGSQINSTFWDKTFVLNTPFRFKDESLVNVLNVLKRKDIITSNFLEDNFTFCDSYTKDANDLHICYTNTEVNSTNREYNEDKTSRYMVSRKWKFNAFTVQNGQFLDRESRDILVQELYVQQNIIVPAMAVTSHKLQGWTAQPSHNVYIHLDDFLSDKISDVDFMHALWVALTRAPSLKQVKFYAIDAKQAANEINKRISSDWLQTLNGVETTQDSAFNEIITLLDNCEYKREDDVRYVEWLKKYGKAHTGPHKKTVKKSKSKCEFAKGTKEYAEFISNAHSGAHKAHKSPKASTLDIDDVKAFKSDHSLRETAKHFNVSTTTITKLLK